MKYAIGCLAILLMATGIHAEIEAPKPVTGLWLVKKKDVVVEVKPCSKTSEKLCGYIAWLDPNAKQQLDSLNPDATLRTRPLCGIRVMWDMVPEVNELGTYSGKIYKANNGTIYDARIKRGADDTLELRGYIGVPLLGKDAVLTPVKKGAYRLCTQRNAPARQPLMKSGQTPSKG